MPKGKGVRDALQVLREYQASLAPQKGFFSTLDELMQEAPFESAPVDQWRGYLKPGRMLQRDVMQFPFKSEELEYSELNTIMDAIERGGYRRLSGKTIGDLTDEDMVDPLGTIDPSSVDKTDLLNLLRRHRPSFALTVGDETLVSPDWTSTRGGPRSEDGVRARLAQLYDPDQPKGMRRFEVTDTSYGPGSEFGPARLSHESPDSTYQESITRLNELQGPHGHFGHNALSHSRTSSHASPNGKIRLVEEIQSDIHERAAKRSAGPDDESWRDFATPEELRTADQIDDMINRGGDFDRLNEVDQQNLLDQQKAIVDAAVSRAPRRGYRSKEDDERYNALDEHVEGYRPDDEDAFIRRYEDAVPDAPFKGPADYGRLELRKQLLNAVNEGEDYLALTRGADQVARYSQNERKGAGMEYVYDTLYRGELEKLARQYGTEVVDVQVPLKTTGDNRPRIMRDSQLETADELEEFMNGGMLQGDMDELFSDTSYIDSVFYQLSDLAEETEIPQAEYDRLKTNLRGVLENVGVRFEENGRALGIVRSSDRDPTPRESPATGAREVNQNDRDMWMANMNWLANHVRGWMNGPGRARVKQDVKTFPALKITDEVRRRVRDIGVPLWKLGAGAVGLEALRQEAGEEPSTDRIGFAKGGSVKRVMAELFDAKEGAGAVPNNQDVNYRGFATEMPIWKFLYLAKHLRDEDVRRGSVKHIKEHIAGGGKLGQPFLNAKWLEDEQRWQITGHDGRHRAKVLAETYGDDALIPVHVFPAGEMRARHLDDFMRAAPMVPESWAGTEGKPDAAALRGAIKGFQRGGAVRVSGEGPPPGMLRQRPEGSKLLYEPEIEILLEFAKSGTLSEFNLQRLLDADVGWVKEDFVPTTKDKFGQNYGLGPQRLPFQRGGLTPSQAELATHRAPQETLDEESEYPVKEAAKRGDPRYLARLLASLKEQWAGLGPDGSAVSPIYSDWDAPQEDWTFNDEAQMLLPPQRGAAPGIALDMARLPADFWPLVQAAGVDREAPEFASRAQASSDALAADVMDEFDLSDPQGFLEHTAHSAGMMLGQIPVAGTGAAAKAPGMLRRALTSPIEFFSPVVKPGVGAYTSGALFGGALNEYGDDVARGVVGMFQEDPEAALAASRELPHETRVAILEHLLKNSGQ